MTRRFPYSVIYRPAGNHLVVVSCFHHRRMPGSWKPANDGQGAIAKEIVAQRDKAFFGRQGNLTVSFAGDEQAIAGVYADVVNLVIKAK